MGIAGTGKKTIGEAITHQDNTFKLAHHHGWIDPVLKLFGTDASVWYELDEKGWAALNQARDVIFNTIANVCSKTSNFIITFEMLANNPYHREFFEKVCILAKKREAKLIPVRLICDLDELLSRLQQPDRKSYLKTQDIELIKNRYNAEKVFFSEMSHELTLDVTNITPIESARKILKWVADIQSE